MKMDPLVAFFHRPPLSPHFTGAVVASRPKDRCHWSSTLAAATLQLPRTQRCFDVIETDPYLDYRLPKRPNATAGVILKGIYDTVDHILKVHQPCIYKLGFTHDPHFRFHNNIYGYIRELDQWEKMTVIYASHEPISCAFVEGALIQRHKGNLRPLKYIYVFGILGSLVWNSFLPFKTWWFIDFGVATPVYSKRLFTMDMMMHVACFHNAVPTKDSQDAAMSRTVVKPSRLMRWGLSLST